MTTDILFAQPQHGARPLIAEFSSRHPLFAGAALCLLILMAPTLFAMAIEQRTFLGINVWMKPLKFELALTAYLATLAWFAGWLPRAVADAWWHRVFSGIVVLAITLEMIWIAGAAAFGVASHFNDSSSAMIGIYGLMGALAVLLTSATLVYGIIILRDRASRLDPAFRLSVGIGLIATFILTVAFAGYMSTTDSHFVGGNQSDAEGLALMGWARDGGDLRVAHFFATHAMHFIPAFGFVVSRLLEPHLAGRAVLGFAGLFVGWTGYTFVEALSGRPFLAMLY
ncbi:hypothetical protein [Dongia deserti]|uniref:hypothetical protein n=1 Tax=Dongia deserti TaxID=2268030 RepID=UPI0013C4DF5E|nr:hypothetical protein [Dongia deserti]